MIISIFNVAPRQGSGWVFLRRRHLKYDLQSRHRLPPPTNACLWTRSSCTTVGSQNQGTSNDHHVHLSTRSHDSVCGHNCCRVSPPLHRFGVVAEIVFENGIKTVRLRSTVEVKNMMSVAIVVQFWCNKEAIKTAIINPGSSIWAPLQVFSLLTMRLLLC